MNVRSAPAVAGIAAMSLGVGLESGTAACASIKPVVC